MCVCVYTVHASSGQGQVPVFFIRVVYSIAVLFLVPNDPCDERDLDEKSVQLW